MSWEFYGKPMIICYSGGKDSDVLLHLAEQTLPLTDFEVLNSHTTVDAPETVYHIRDTVKRINKLGGVSINKISEG
jgi:phosphoadenosine phosphosulfate reductase